MPNTPVLATAEGMPAINRRRMLLGLAAASTAAAAYTVSPAAHSAPLESKTLLQLADELPKAVAAYKAALDAEEWILAEWKHVWPLAPDCITLPNAHFHPEADILGRPIIRSGQKNPLELRDVRNLAALIDMSAHGASRKRTPEARQKSARRIWSARQALRTGKAYYAETERLRDLSGATKAQAATAAALARITATVAAIMDHEPVTVAGVIVQAEAMVIWSKRGSVFDKVFNPGRADWGRKFAASVLRIAGGQA